MENPLRAAISVFLTHSETLRDHNSATVVQMELKLAGRLVYDVILMIMQKKKHFSILSRSAHMPGFRRPGHI